MNLKELKYVVFFDYIKDIRRYSYEIEDFSKENFGFEFLEPIPPIPDEIEPFFDRFVISNRKEASKDVVFKLSQLSFSISFFYKNEIEKNIENELNELKNIVTQVKSFLKDKIKTFKISHEIVGSLKNSLNKNIEDINIFNISNDKDELLTREVIEKDNKYFIMEEKSAIKVFNTPNTNPNKPMFLKNSQEYFLGWQVSFYKEISNRLEYNKSKEEKEFELDFEDIKELLC